VPLPGLVETLAAEETGDIYDAGCKYSPHP
jgi:hypothetical protein